MLGTNKVVVVVVVVVVERLCLSITKGETRKILIKDVLVYTLPNYAI